MLSLNSIVSSVGESSVGVSFSATSIDYSKAQYLELSDGSEYVGQTTNTEESPVPVPSGLGLCLYRKTSNLFIGQFITPISNFNSDINSSTTSTANTSSTVKGCLIYNYEAEPQHKKEFRRYEGEFKVCGGGGVEEPEPHGFGQLFNPKDKSILCGQFVEGKPVGLCVHMSSTTKGTEKAYLGEFAEGKYAGIGVCYYTNGDVYSGEYINGFRSGYGEYLLENGHCSEIHCGIWSKDRLVRQIASENDSEWSTLLGALLLKFLA